MVGGWVCESWAPFTVSGRSDESVTSDAIEFGSVVLSGTTNPCEMVWNRSEQSLILNLKQEVNVFRLKLLIFLNYFDM